MPKQENKKGKEEIYSTNESSMETGILQTTDEKSTYRTSICLKPRYKKNKQKNLSPKNIIGRKIRKYTKNLEPASAASGKTQD